ncbi:MAG: type IV pilin protein [Steroidobacteraceae bacterium]
MMHPRRSTPRTSPRTAVGFTLIELMITLLVIAILSAVAYPIYEHQVIESRRTEARSALLELAAREERYYATQNAYTTSASSLGYTGTWPITIGSDNMYEMEAPQLSNNPPGYTLTVVPVPGSVQQQNDTTCASFSVNSAGVESSTNSANAPNSPEPGTCW